MKILLTGASGFIGRALGNQLVSMGHEVVGATRNHHNEGVFNSVQIGEIGPHTDWTKALNGADSIVHLASRVHVLKDKAEDPLDAFRYTNVFGTERLLNDAIKAGIKRLVFLSSIKVNGESTDLIAKGFNETHIPAPNDPYSISKWEAEQILNDASNKRKIETVILRSPLVYGPGVKANFLRLLNLVHKRIPLPFASINNKRSLIAIDNLVDIITNCIKYDNISGETFIVCDGEDLSTTALIERISDKMSKRPILFKVSSRLIKTSLSLLNKESVYSRLWGSLVADSTKIRQRLNWKPLVSLNDGIAKTAKWYLSELD